MTEEEFEGCIQRIRSGDKDGLKEIYEAYFPYLYTVIFCVVKNKENAEDVVSDFFIRLWTLADSYRPGNGHKGYLATVARNMAIDFLRKRKREVLTAGFGENTGQEENGGGSLTVSTEGKIGTHAKEAQEDSPEQQVVSKLGLQETLARLKPAEREIINLKICGELTFREISEVLDMPMGTVTWQYREAIKKIRRCGYGQ